MNFFALKSFNIDIVCHVKNKGVLPGGTHLPDQALSRSILFRTQHIESNPFQALSLHVNCYAVTRYRLLLAGGGSQRRIKDCKKGVHYFCIALSSLLLNHELSDGIKDNGVRFMSFYLIDRFAFSSTTRMFACCFSHGPVFQTGKFKSTISAEVGCCVKSVVIKAIRRSLVLLLWVMFKFI